jgi:hypothetical protein
VGSYQSEEVEVNVQGRRLPVVPGQHPVPELPGDYIGPVVGYTADKPAVFFLKPNARDPDAPRVARSVHHVTSPPHTFTEEPDGTLTIRASLGDTRGGNGESDGWHGFLTHGFWEKV